MIGRLIRFFIVAPAIAYIWSAANQLGFTTLIEQQAGVDIPNEFVLPGLKLSEEVRNESRRQLGLAVDKATREPRRKLEAKAKAELEKLTGRLGDVTVPNADQIIDTLPGTPGAAREAKTALKALNALPVKGRAPMTGYSREHFGTEWDDAVTGFEWSRNGCDTRNDVLKRDLVNITFKAGTRDCKVVSGTLPLEPYTGTKNYRFDAYDNDYATDLDIEHICSLGNAWVTGAQSWTVEKRSKFANDPMNLMAADPSSNRQKGDADFATWLPPNKAYRATYAVRQIAIKEKYGLWVTQAEKDAMKRVLEAATA